MKPQQSMAKDTGRRAAFLLVLSVFLQSLFAVHLHAENFDVGPSDTFENCIVCVLKAPADDDDIALLCNTAALSVATGGSFANQLPMERLSPYAPLTPAHPTRAPPSAYYPR